ncbi:MAG: dTDP-4-dehydrorhamnose 3,5-epimerase family protein [Candidatus Magasanikbacteria bacterium]
MNVINIKELMIPGVKVIQFSRFLDSRGYFTETFRKSDVKKYKELEFIKGIDFVQFNESYVKAGVLKGLHFQWQPPLGKLLRVVSGHMVDIILDLREGSLTEGKIIMYDMEVSVSEDYSEWIWLPHGVAHGNFFLKDSMIEYFFTTDYNPAGEDSISPLSQDFDWSLCDESLINIYSRFQKKNFIISDKDKNSLSLLEWQKNNKLKKIFYV